jgi:hypothetical protein
MVTRSDIQAATPPTPIPDPAKGKRRKRAMLANAAWTASPRFTRDCAGELRLPIHTIVCFEAGRFAFTQSSWAKLTQRCSRKWMSGHAAYALALTADRGQFTTRKLYTSGEPILPGRGKSPLSLDSYLLWMSRKGRPVGVWLRHQFPGPPASPAEALRWVDCAGKMGP